MNRLLVEIMVIGDAIIENSEESEEHVTGNE